MSSGKSIAIAFMVVQQTYESIYKLLYFCQTSSFEKGEFETMTPMPKFLRWKSDKEYQGWAIMDFILLFQSKKDEVMENGWHRGPLYVFEINLNPSNYDEPTVNIARFDYVDIENWKREFSPADHWSIYKPLIDSENMDFSEEGSIL